MTHIRFRRRKTDLHLVFVVTSALWLVVGGAFALAVVLTVHRHHHLGVALVSAAVSASGGWLLVALMGHAHKVIPFISWSELRARGVKEKADGTQLMFADLYNHQLAVPPYGVVTGDVVVTSFGPRIR